jgi:hypothetical protein
MKSIARESSIVNGSIIAADTSIVVSVKSALPSGFVREDEDMEQ